MASVRKRKWNHNGVDGEAWIVSYTDQNGKRRQKTFEKKKDADRYRTTVENEIVQGVHTADADTITVSEAAKLFLEDCERRRKIGDMTGGGLRGYQYKIGKQVVEGLGTHKLSRLNSNHLQDFFDTLRLEYSAHTVVGVHMSLSALITFAVRKKWVRRNVLRDEPLRLPKPGKRLAVPSKADIVKLLDVSSNRTHWEGLRPMLNRRAMVCLGIFGGLRPGEMMGLQWSNIDWDRELVLVRHSLSRSDGLKVPKSDAGNRDVPMTPQIREALEQLLIYQQIRTAAHEPSNRSRSRDAVNDRIRVLWEKRAEFSSSVPLSEGYVLLSRYGGPLRSDNSGDFFNKLMKDADLWDEKRKSPRFTLHALRHAAASLFIEHGLPAINLKTVMGHASVSTTYNIYGHLFPEDTRTTDAAAAISKAFSATSTQQGLLSH